MKKFNKYVLKIYLLNLISVLALILILYTFFQIIQHTKYLSKYNTSLFNILVYDFLKIPYSIYQVFPVAGATAVVITILKLIKNNELIAYLSLGGKIKDLVLLIVILNFIFTGILIYYSDVINPKIESIRKKFKEEKIYKEKYIKNFSLTDFYFKEKNFIYSIGLIAFDKKTFFDITIYKIKDNNIIKVVKADKAIYKGNNVWIFYNYKSFDTSDIPKIEYSYKKLESLDNTLTQLINLPSDEPKRLTFKELDKIIKTYESKGLNADKYKLIYYNKISVPLILIVMIIFLIPLSIDISRNYQYIKIASKSLSFSMLFWILQSICISLGKSGILTPVLANFTSHIIFTFFGLYLITKKEKGL
ncbi:LptF/LptG family permease [Deferribacter abyssi]|uniref:LptF/LptG family permease n=1 Tax=Deferribacter abyssi TaxID=213806 RepID=UPI003C29E12E